MPAWKNRLHPNEVVMVSAYVANLRGQNLTGPRPPEGPVIPPWPKAPPTKEQLKPAAGVKPAEKRECRVAREVG